MIAFISRKVLNQNVKKNSKEIKAKEIKQRKHYYLHIFVSYQLQLTFLIIYFQQMKEKQTKRQQASKQANNNWQ